jgi:hypothetical protein
VVGVTPDNTNSFAENKLFRKVEYLEALEECKNSGVSYFEINLSSGFGI